MSSDVHVLQLGDATYCKAFAKFSETIRKLAHKNGYEYRQKIINTSSHVCMYTQKVLAVRELLLQIPSSHWLLYIDLDVAYAGGVIPTTLLRTNCDFVAQNSDPAHVNSGIFFIKNSPIGRSLIESWSLKQIRYHPCRSETSADQLTLQDSILEILSREYRAQNEPCLRVCQYDGCLNDCVDGPHCTPKKKTAPFDWNKGDAYSLLSDKCFAGRMALLASVKSKQNLCLLPQKARFNVHDFSTFHAGDAFFAPFTSVKWAILNNDSLETIEDVLRVHLLQGGYDVDLINRSIRASIRVVQKLLA